MLDLLVRRATLPDGRRQMDIACQGGRIVELAPHIEAAQVALEIDAGGCLVTPPFVDSHFHLDSTLSYGRPRVNRSGTLLEGIALWGEFAETISADDVKARARMLCHWAIARGNLAIRSHVDVSNPELVAVRALLELREELQPYLDLQLVAFPQEGYLRNPEARAALTAALDLGVDVVGGIPHLERTMAEGARSVTLLCELAAERGLPVDLHCDESDDPLSRHIETLARETVRLGLQGRVTGSHLTSMHAMDDATVSKLLRLMREAQVHAIANPLINITLQGRHDAFPKGRGMTRVKEMMDCGINVSFGHDCVLDPWYALGSHDMLEVAHMGLHVAHMTGVDEMRACFDAVTRNGARTLGLAHYGLEAGCYADMVVLQASDTIEALRTHPARLHVIRRGRVKEMMDCGINVSFGHDCVLDPWYALGSHDLLEVAHMGLHVAHMTGVDEMRACFDAVTRNGARTLGLAHYGLEAGCYADMVVLQASDTIEALRIHPARLHVIRRGRVIASTPKSHATLALGEQQIEVDFAAPSTDSI